MRSNEAPAIASWAPFALVLAAALAAIATVRAPLAERYHSLSTEHDTYPLPSPEQTVVMSLGYRSALADLIYGHVLVSYGLHFQEDRLFEFVGDYLRTVNELDPKYADPYRYADTLLTLQPEVPPRRHYFEAKDIFERGMRELPYHTELHLTAGQFMAYLAPPHLESEQDKNLFRRAGRRALAQTCELTNDNEAVPYHCITAARLMNREGETEAMVRFLERVIAVTDDEGVHRYALGYLEQRLGAAERDRAKRRFDEFNEAWRRDLPFTAKDRLLVVGPRFDPAACAGELEPRSRACATTWRDWAEARPTADR